MEQFDKFIGDIIDAKQLTGLTADAKEGLVEEMRDRLLDMIDRSLISALSDEKISELSGLLDDESFTEEQMQQFVVDNGVDVEKVTAKTMLAFRNLYLDPSGYEANQSEE